MTNDSIKLAQLWIKLKEMKDDIDNEILPLAEYLGIGKEDMELMEVMEEFSLKIKIHFEKYKLIAEIQKTKTAQ